MAIVEVKCPLCGQTKVHKYGKSKYGKQRYCCYGQNCPAKKFQLEYSYEGSKPETDKKIISMAANASGIQNRFALPLFRVINFVAVLVENVLFFLFTAPCFVVK